MLPELLGLPTAALRAVLRLVRARRDGSTRTALEAAEIANARQVAMVVVGASATFAPTAPARARLLRQLHASGALTGVPPRE